MFDNSIVRFEKQMVLIEATIRHDGEAEESGVWIDWYEKGLLDNGEITLDPGNSPDSIITITATATEMSYRDDPTLTARGKCELTLSKREALALAETLQRMASALNDDADEELTD